MSASSSFWSPIWCCRRYAAIAARIARDWPAISNRSASAPFGNVTRYWTATESNTLMPAFDGALLANRLIWLGVGLAALGVAYWRFSFAEKGISQRSLRRQAKAEARLAADERRSWSPRCRRRAPNAAAGRPAARPRRFEMAQVFKSPAFFVLLLIGLFNAGGACSSPMKSMARPARPLTFALIDDAARRVRASSRSSSPSIMPARLSGAIAIARCTRSSMRPRCPTGPIWCPRRWRWPGVLFATLAGVDGGGDPDPAVRAAVTDIRSANICAGICCPTASTWSSSRCWRCSCRRSAPTNMSAGG